MELFDRAPAADMRASDGRAAGSGVPEAAL